MIKILVSFMTLHPPQIFLLSSAQPLVQNLRWSSFAALQIQDEGAKPNGSVRPLFSYFAPWPEIRLSELSRALLNDAATDRRSASHQRPMIFSL
jgi:hypothetical protein